MRQLIRLGLAMVLSSACSFKGGSGGDVDVDGDVDAGDADGESDSGGDACEAWGPRAFFDACMIGELDPSNSLGDTVIDNDWTYNTDNNEFTTTAGSPSPPVLHSFLTQLGGVPVRMWLVGSLEISLNDNLRVVGGRPLVIASLDSIWVRGEIDVSSRYLFIVDTGPSFAVGAGQSRADCTLGADLDGNDDSNGGSGGGGGAYATVGGAGGAGGDGAAAKKPGGDAIAVGPGMLFSGGCRGGDGGDGNDGQPGEGGFGGGAVMLTAIGNIDIDGSICAGGAAGFGQTEADRNGGGGGGSGGLIVLEAETIDLQSSDIGANGGGGGGGADGNVLDSIGASSFLAGQNGDCSRNVAAGAIGEAGVSGGDGAARNMPATDGSDGSAGGGGGGGGNGVVLIVAPDRDAVISEDSTRISPVPHLVDSNLATLPN